jgi:simple sugar transport system ATP-binding protein
MEEQKQNCDAVVFVGEDLDVQLELCDRILVLCAGQFSGVVDARKTTKEEVGLLMTHLG